MNKLMALSLALMASSYAVADEVSLDIQMNIEGTEIYNRCTFSADMQEYRFEEGDIAVVATAVAEGEDVFMNFKIFKKHENGDVLMAEPVIKTVRGEVARLEMKNEAGEELISLNVVANK